MIADNIERVGKDNLKNEKVDKGVTETLTPGDRRAALLSVTYLLLILAFFCWQLFDTWIGQHILPRWAGYDVKRLDTPGFRLIAYTVIGGGLGGTINGIRSCLQYYHGFSQRYLWKYITAPWMGASLALLVYALIHSSVSVFGGGSTTNEISTTQTLANFAAGALAGYGSKDVFIWLDAQVQKLFQVPQEPPNVEGKSEEAAKSQIQSAGFEVGAVTEIPQGDGKAAGTVVEQTPAPDETLARGAPVDITVVTDKPDSETGSS